MNLCSVNRLPEIRNENERINRETKVDWLFPTRKYIFKHSWVTPLYSARNFYWPIFYFSNNKKIYIVDGFMWKPYHFEGQEHLKKMSLMENITWKQQKMMEVHEDWLTGKEKGTNPFYSPSLHTSHGPPLLAPRCAAKLSRLRRESSLRRPAPSSLVVPCGGRSERRARKEKNGASKSPVPFQRHIISHTTAFTQSHTSKSPSTSFSFHMKLSTI